jgi:hypothetical protein
LQHRKADGRQPEVFGIVPPREDPPQVPPPRRSQSLGAVFQLRFAGRTRAVDAAENLPVRFNAVSDDPAVAVGTNWRQRVDRALEAIEGVMLPANDHFKRLVIFIFANFACSHTQIFRAP